ncbi:sensor histidine kinase [[Clostridium] hylemonae]|uniref:histidine kinase n=1 Tax=[Clostridium] hylemonae DSM 15053 TaxID=553973 RepID=C0C5A9_9FIRM|nr:HAMP domain-containing sensor histidine kinase [[Clostridium] hylemonae]EEG72646.1 histidine kinase A domain protein [[Clostridium] hylemonae DSM 15053]QEK16473.1 Alkaline phosphatase synthesis sensor protein PhoR [[Clostridium] hylemonae DSM 15053]
MNQWYKTNLTKGILIVAEHVLAVVAAASLVWVLTYPALMGDLFSGHAAKKFEDSTAFSGQLQTATTGILEGVNTRGLFETEGRYDPERIVDIKEFYDNDNINNKNSSGLAYRLGDLRKWAESSPYSDGNIIDDSKEPIIVCKRSDGTFRYYYFAELEQLVNDGELSFVIANNSSGEEVSSDQILYELRNGGRSDVMYSTETEAEFKGLQNREGKIEFIDCWNYDGYQIEEKYAPLGAANLLEIANENPAWNGKLNDVFQMLEGSLYNIYNRTETYESWENSWKEGDTNLVYLYADTVNKKIYTNKEEYKDFSRLDESLKAMAKNGKYLIVKPKLSDFSSNIENEDAATWKDLVRFSGPAKENFVYAVGVDTSYPIQDSFYSQNKIYEKYGSRIQGIAILGLTSAILFMVGIVWLTIIAGRNNRDEELHLNWFDRWKTELAAALVIMLWIGPVLFVGSGISQYFAGQVPDYSDTYAMAVYSYNAIPGVVRSGIVAAYTCGLFLIGYMSLVRRIKTRTVWSNSIIKSLCSFIKQLFVNMHFVWKTVILFCLFGFVHWLAVLSGAIVNWFWFLVMLIVEALAFIYLVRMSIARQKIRSGIEHISSGEVNYKIPLDGLKGEQLMLAERVNSIGEGLDAALEESMKSERLKTDLITNVSHDIKTPLTSIINYIDLLKLEHLEDPKIQRYLEVLEAKAQRLKTLTEDVVEASKVSSGNITLDFMNINLVEMIQQTSGEFEEKFTQRNLNEVLNLPEEEAVIRADGRRMWRVLENIYNNAAKYAMEGTRVYADLRITDSTITFSLKNVSDQPLNFTADELTERFLRGDVSRSTEGSGLGLSIAKSLTSMQGGSFDLYLDGDLFKVTITFPRVAKAVENVENE